VRVIQRSSSIQRQPSRRAEMASLWERIQALEGWMLKTVSGREFEITAVDDRSALVVPRSSGKPRRPLKREDFERAEALGLATADVIPDQLSGVGIDEYNRSYIAAIIRATVEQITSA
jgi:hypothetical protein